MKKRILFRHVAFGDMYLIQEISERFYPCKKFLAKRETACREKKLPLPLVTCILYKKYLKGFTLVGSLWLKERLLVMKKKKLHLPFPYLKKKKDARK